MARDFMTEGDVAHVWHGRRALRVLVSSTVYNKEDFLERVYRLLSGLDYEVEMSYAGTLGVDSQKTAYDNCLDAVERCDLFLGIITTDYGSGIVPPSGISITHAEILKAIEFQKPRWMLVDSRVPFMRNWLKAIGVVGRTQRRAFAANFPKCKDAKVKSPMEIGKHAFDLRTIDMYEDAIRDLEKPNAVKLEERQGNWVQPYSDPSEIERFVMAQFGRFCDAYSTIKEFFHG